MSGKSTTPERTHLATPCFQREMPPSEMNRHWPTAHLWE
jgi:hypothetical protein